MRSFSKKLAFVLAAAMVVTGFAPAAQAKAADEMAINKSSQILYVNEGINHKGNEGVPAGKGNVSVYDFSVKNKPSNWKTAYSFAWSSSNEDVVTVKAGGVATAVGVGKATVYCKVTEKATKKVTTLKTAVEVKENAAKVAIKNADKYDGTTVEVNGVVDLDRVMYNAAGKSTTKKGTLVTDCTRWVAEPSKGVEINQSNGKFTFTEEAEAGDYTLYCETYQSSKYTKTTATSDKIVVTFVGADAFEVDQTASNGFNLLFNKAADVKIADVTVNKIIAVGTSTGKIPMVVSNVTMSEDKKTASVSLFSNFENGATYEISVKGYDEVATLTAFVGAPVSMTISSKSNLQGGLLIHTNTLTDLTYTMFDEQGNDVTNKATGTVIFSAANANTTDYYVSGNSIYISKNGAEVAVNAEYHTYEWDDKGNEKTIKATGYFVGVDKAPDSIASVSVATKLYGNAFAGNKVPVSYGTVDLEVKIKTTAWGDQETAYSYGTPLTKLDPSGRTKVQFRSTNPDVLDLAAGGNKITLFKEGTSAILVDLVTMKDDGTTSTTTIAAAYVTVLSKSVVSAITVGGGASVVVGTVAPYNKATLDITAKDQYGGVFSIKNDINPKFDASGERIYSDFTEVKFIDGSAVPAGSVYLDPRGGHNNWQDKLVVTSDIVKGMLSLDEAGNPIWKINGVAVNEVSKRVVVKTQPFCEPYPFLTFTFNVTVKKPVDGQSSYAVVAENVTSGNIGRFVTPWDGNNFNEKVKTVEFKVYTKSNNITTGQAPLKAKPEGYAVPAEYNVGELCYSVTHDGVDITNLTALVDNTVMLDYSSVANIPEGATVTGSAVAYSSNYKNLGAGNYVFTVYQVVAASNGVKSYAFVGTTSATVTCDTGSYSFVKRTSENATHGEYRYNGNVLDLASQQALRDCFEINGRDGQKTTNTAFFVKAKDASTAVYVESITFYEDLGGGVYAPYTVNINVSLKK